MNVHISLCQMSTHLLKARRYKNASKVYLLFREHKSSTTYISQTNELLQFKQCWVIMHLALEKPRASFSMNHDQWYICRLRKSLQQRAGKTNLCLRTAMGVSLIPAHNACTNSRQAARSCGGHCGRNCRLCSIKFSSTGRQLLTPSFRSG